MGGKFFSFSPPRMVGALIDIGCVLKSWVATGLHMPTEGEEGIGGSERGKQISKFYLPLFIC
jgi:hypothetical protein